MDTLIVEHRMVEASGTSWHVVEAGAGPTLVLVAGFPQSWYAFRKVIPLLAERYHVIAIDLPGQGDSGPSRDGYDAWSLSEQLLGLLKTLSIDRSVLVGHDVGAWVAFPFVHRYPEHLRGVVFADGNIAGINLELNFDTGYAGWHFVFNRVPQIPELLIPGHERPLLEWIMRRGAQDFAATFSQADLDEYARVFARPSTLEGMLGYYRAVPENEQRNRELMTARFTVPALAIAGNYSGSSALPEQLIPLGERVSGVVLNGCKHYLAEEQPLEFTATVLEFVDSLGE